MQAYIKERQEFTQNMDKDKNYTKITDGIYVHNKTKRIKYCYLCLTPEEKLLLKDRVDICVPDTFYKDLIIEIDLDYNLSSTMINFLNAYCEKYSAKDFILKEYNMGVVDFLENFDKYKNYYLKECLLQGKDIYVISGNLYKQNTGKIFEFLNKNFKILGYSREIICSNII